MIYIVAHKAFEMPKKVTEGGYTPIFVGGGKEYARSNNSLTDDKGNDQISFKNPTFCELTALYWMWKNDKQSEYIGLNHYRRYFLSDVSHQILTSSEVDSLMSMYDVILSSKIRFKSSVRMLLYRTSCYIKDIKLMEKVVKNLYPDYSPILKSFLEGNVMSFANMFVMSKQNLDKYCEWLFSILFEMEKEENMDGYTNQEKRLYGYLGELLINVWVEYNKMNVIELPVCNVEIGNQSKLTAIKTKMIRNTKNIIKGILYFPSGIPFRRRL